ncbi:MAG: valine--pyruvate transaminase [Gammaproteobacteria bacterium]|nr:valine--pyruvate transaminase [Gammaproteobacteria bacterium]
MKLSRLGERLSATTGTLELMRDLGEALDADEPPIMLGGGNPASIPAVEDVFRRRLMALTQQPETLARVAGVYDGPRGDTVFHEAIARLLCETFGWPISAANVAITNGSQNAFFYLFTLFGGTYADGGFKRIFLPLTPEYIGYGDIGVEEGMFVAGRPRIELLPDGLFKYRLNLSGTKVPDDIGAICVSRPTNPTGNVLTGDELAQLAAIAKARDVPLIIDNAYGTPFPDIIYSDASPVFADNTVVVMSLSKLGIPGLRTGIVIADENVIRALAAVNALFALAPNSIGPALALELVQSGEIVAIGKNHIRPFYEQRAHLALAWLRAGLDGYPCHIHKPEGAFFLWLWCEGLPVDSADLYRRLKARGVVVVPGHYFFPGMTDDWPHRRECLRISYAQDEKLLRRGLEIIAEEVVGAYERGRN